MTVLEHWTLSGYEDWLIRTIYKKLILLAVVIIHYMDNGSSKKMACITLAIIRSRDILKESPRGLRRELRHWKIRTMTTIFSLILTLIIEIDKYVENVWVSNKF